ncbi:unnamed protein product [Camellia sinensis]
MKLIGQAQIWWSAMEHEPRIAGQPIVNCGEMEQRMKQKYLPYDYKDELFDRLTNLRQGNLIVVEYMNKFEELKIQCRGVEDPRQTLSRFKSGLRDEIRKAMVTHRVFTVDEEFQLALKIEKKTGLDIASRFHKYHTQS